MSSADYLVWFFLTAALAGLTTFGSLTAAYFVGQRERRRTDPADRPAAGEEARPGEEHDLSRTAA